MARKTGYGTLKGTIMLGRQPIEIDQSYSKWKMDTTKSEDGTQVVRIVLTDDDGRQTYLDLVSHDDVVLR